MRALGRVGSLSFVALTFVAACGKSAPSGGGAAGSTTSGAVPATAATDASLPLPVDAAPRPTVRLPVTTTRASAEVDEPGNQRLAEHAFDGDPTGGWCVKKTFADAWVEATLGAPQRLRHVTFRAGLGGRVGEGGKLSAQHGRVTHAALIFDDGGAGKELDVRLDDPTRDVFDVDAPASVVATRVRVRVIDGLKGKKHDDACLADVAIFGEEPTAEAPAGNVPSAHGTDLDTLVTSLPSKHEAVWPFLERLGFSERLKPIAQLARLKSTERLPVNLDADDAPESIVHLTFTQSFGEFHLERHAFAVLDDEARREVVLGRRWVLAQTCNKEDVDEAPPDPTLVALSPHVVHSKRTLDLVVRTMMIDKCDAPNTAGRDGLELWTIDRGALETLAVYQVGFSPAGNEGSAYSLLVDCATGEGPCKLRGLGGLAGQSAQYAFDPERFVYR